MEVEREIREWSEGEPKALVSSNYPVYTPSTADAGDILFATRSVDPVAAAAEARRFGLWANAEVTDALWPSKDQRTRPLMPLRKGHMAMLIAAGFLDNLQLEADGRRILVKGKTTKELVLVKETPDKETYRERLRTTVVALGACPRKTLFVIILTTSEHIGKQRNANRTVVQCALCTSLVSENTQTHS